MEFQKLTVQNYSDDPQQRRRITLSPPNITVIAAALEDVTVEGRSARNVTVLFIDGGSIDLCVNHSDLSMLEEAIGSYCLG